MTDQKINPKLRLCSILAGITVLFLMVQPSMADFIVTPSGYWQMEQTNPGADGVVDDMNAVNGTCATCPGSTTGQVNNGFDFSTADAGVDFAGSDDADIFDIAADASFSVEFWIKTDTDIPEVNPPDRQVMVGRFQDSNRYWWVGIEDDETISVQFKSSNVPTPDIVKSTTSVLSNGWHHVAVVFDRAAGDISIYIDAKKEGSRSLDTVDNGNYEMGEATPLTLGYLSVGDQFYFAGQLDNLAIYNAKALTADEVALNYGSGANGVSLDQEYAPVFSGDGDAVVAAGFPLELTATASGNPGPETYSSDNLPVGAEINDTTGVINWTPSNLQIGANDFTVKAQSRAGEGSQDWTVDVVDLCEGTALGSYFNLDEASGGPFKDFKQNVGDATCTDDACPAQEEGKVGSAQTFDGTDDQVDIPANDIYNWAGGTNFSIELWMKAEANPTARQVMIGSIGGGAIWWIAMDPDGNIVAQFRDGNGASTDRVTPTNISLADGQWHHIVVVREFDEGSTDQGTLSLYVDGELGSETQSLEEGNTGPIATGVAVNLGYLNTGGFFRFAGSLDEVATYNIALNATMVNQHFNAREGQPYCNTPPRITSSAPANATEGEEYIYEPVAEDDDQPIAWALSVKPEGMEIDAATGRVTWTPGPTVTESETYTIVATDAFGAAASQKVDLSVTVTDNNAPTIISQPVTTAAEGAAYTYEAEGQDPDGDTLTWSIDAANAPQGMSVDGASGVVSWTPAEGTAGTSVSYTLTVSDGKGGTATQDVTVEVGTGTGPGGGGGDDDTGGGGGGGGGGGCFISAL